MGTEDQNTFDITGAAGSRDKGQHAGHLFAMAKLHQGQGGAKVGDNLRGFRNNNVDVGEDGKRSEMRTESAQERFVEAAVDGDDLSGRLAEAVCHE